MCVCVCCMFQVFFHNSMTTHERTEGLTLLPTKTPGMNGVGEGAGVVLLCDPGSKEHNDQWNYIYPHASLWGRDRAISRVIGIDPKVLFIRRTYVVRRRKVSTGGSTCVVFYGMSARSCITFKHSCHVQTRVAGGSRANLSHRVSPI